MATRPGGAGWLELRETYRQALAAGWLDRYRRRHWGRCQEFCSWLHQEALPSLSLPQALALYRGSGGRQTQQFETNSIEEVRDALDFLLYDTVKLEGRFQECAADGGGYRLAGAGKEFVSYLLCLHEPALFAFWSTHGERALRHLGIYPPGLRKGHRGMGYMDLLDALQSVRQAMGLPDFRAVDEFAFVVARHGKASIA